VDKDHFSLTNNMVMVEGELRSEEHSQLAIGNRGVERLIRQWLALREDDSPVQVRLMLSAVESDEDDDTRERARLSRQLELRRQASRRTEAPDSNSGAGRPDRRLSRRVTARGMARLASERACAGRPPPEWTSYRSKRHRPSQGPIYTLGDIWRARL
jgi:hypothetical protein